MTIADAIYVKGQIVTMNDAHPTAEALAVKDGKILAVGKRADVEAYTNKTTRVVDLLGMTLMPGFIDSHSHYISSLQVANQCCLYASPAGPGDSVESIVKALAEFANAKKLKDGKEPEEIVAYGYDDTMMRGRPLNHKDLDIKGFPETRVVVGHVSMHGCVLNWKALQYYGYLDPAYEIPPGGVIVRGTNGEYGMILETAYEPVLRGTPKMTPEQEFEASRMGQMLYAEAGITTAHEGNTQLSDLRLMHRTSGENIIDIIAFPYIDDLDDVLKEFPVKDYWSKYVNHLKIGGVKLILDGSPQAKTAYFTTPYKTEGPAGWYGSLTMQPEQVNEAVKKVYDLGLPLDVHANGDGAIDVFLKAHEFAAAGDLSRDRHVTLVHAQFARYDHLAKFLEYKIRPSFFTLHTFYFAEAHVANRGETQAHYISPMRDAIDMELRPGNHTDFTVAPLDQMRMLSSAVHRVSRNGAVIGPDQRITTLEGLKAMTIWAAEQYGEQASKGSLEPGKLADFVITEINPLDYESMLEEVSVVATIKEGHLIYGTDD